MTDLNHKEPQDDVTPRTVRLVVVINTIRFALGAGIGWWAFAASNDIARRVAPWNTVSVDYLAWMFVAGVASTIFRPIGFWWGLIGLYGSQAALIWLTFPLIRMIPAMFELTFIGMAPAIVGVILGISCGLSTLYFPTRINGRQRASQSASEN